MDIKLESFSGIITGVAPIVASVMAIVYGMFKCRSEHFQAEKLKVETKKVRAEVKKLEMENNDSTTFTGRATSDTGISTVVGKSGQKSRRIDMMSIICLLAICYNLASFFRVMFSSGDLTRVAVGWMILYAIGILFVCMSLLLDRLLTLLGKTFDLLPAMIDLLLPAREAIIGSIVKAAEAITTSDGQKPSEDQSMQNAPSLMADRPPGAD